MKKVALVLAIIITLSAMSGCGVIWREERQGQAALARARYELQVIEIQAQQRLIAESYNAEAEIIRAKGIAEAMEIINAELTAEYLKHFWIRTLAEHDNVIYVSIESGFPAFFSQER